jgi:predicted Fe-S protein YdhL (DUF1289 family)
VSSTSPCNGACRIDQGSRLCVGCARTLDEIAAWRGASEDEKQRILAELPARRAKFGLDSGDVAPVAVDYSDAETGGAQTGRSQRPPPQ